MRSLTICLLAGAMSAALIPAVSLAADADAKKPAAPYKAPKSFEGHGDLTGVWTNVTITQMERPAAYKDRKVLTPAEVKKLEGDAVDRFVEGNAPTDPNSPATDTTSKKCQGAGGLDCGYNSGWKDSGTRVMRVGGEPRTSFVTTTPDGRVPAPKASAAGGRGRGGPGAGARVPVAASGGEGDVGPSRPGQNDNPESRGLGERCLLSFGNSAGPVMLPLMYNNNYQFVQTKDDVAILVEMVHDVRHIRIGATHLPSNVRPWMGDSIGHWEGDTLVSETTNFPASQNFRGSSTNLKVTEKFTRVGQNALRYQFTVEDPTMWDAAWGGEYEFTPAPGQVYEYACHEGNYALEGILAGARAEEAAAKKSASGATPAAR